MTIHLMRICSNSVDAEALSQRFNDTYRVPIAIARLLVPNTLAVLIHIPLQTQYCRCKEDRKTAEREKKDRGEAPLVL